MVKVTRKKAFRPGGKRGKLHKELGISISEKIPAARLESAAHSPNREIRNDAIRAETMSTWRKSGRSPGLINR